VTATPGLAVLGRSADCPLVLAAAPLAAGGWAVGFAHASWRSTVAGITREMIAALARLGGDPATITAAIAPSAGPCCYEVGDEVRDAALAALGDDVARHFLPRGDRWHFDLWAANLAQLAAAGVAPARVTISGVCTICHGERFWSWRAQGPAAGRFAAAIAGLSAPRSTSA
jgi:copper oxidase (laccase) domain-containing protein